MQLKIMEYKGVEKGYIETGLNPLAVDAYSHSKTLANRVACERICSVTVVSGSILVYVEGIRAPKRKVQP